jgi:hypothetical protein
MRENPLSAVELICRIVADNPVISAIHLFTPMLSPPIQATSGLVKDEEALIVEALELRSRTRFPFWECLLQLISVREVSAPSLVALAARHNAQKPTLEPLFRDEITPEAISAKMRSLPSGTVLALSSKVQCSDSTFKHVPMLDFHCQASKGNDGLVASVAKALGTAGYMAHSGQSYHFYGTELLSIDELVDFLSRALLYSPIVDRAWIAHQLIERACGLRISPGKNYSACPTVFATV